MKKLFLIAAIITILDQVTKYIFKNVHYGIINYTTNTGAAFSLFQGYTLILTIISIIVILLILIIYKKTSELKYSLALMLGGAVGNLIDRILFGYVRDFIDLGFWPVFNIADMSSTIGVIILIYFTIFSKNQRKVLNS